MAKDFSGVQEQAGDPSEPERPDQSTMHRLNILIVDDDEQSQGLLKLILRDTDHAVKFVSNGIEALQAVKSNEIDLVLMDVYMPLMDGLEATRQIRAWENGQKHLAIVGLTAIFETEYWRCLQAGMDDIISKPFDIQQLYQVIDACANQKRIVVDKTIETPGDQSAGSSILDAQGAIKRFAGDQDNYAALLDEFVLSLSDKFKELKNAFEAGDWKKLSNYAHNLKGLSANFGAKELSGKALELDQYVNESQYEQAKQKLNEIVDSIQTLRTEALAFLRNFRNGKGKLI